ncbi:MAG: PP-loop family protein [Desulfovibrionaceae bacterium]|nr:PP-loop family protein [Desulfovibrionaceae bacterium]
MDSLKDILARLPKLAVAFSGGLDSRFLCASCLAEGHDILAVHITGPHIPAAETGGARDFAEAMNLPYAEIEMDPLTVPEVAFTSPRRCYFCKKNLMRGIRERLAAMGEGGRLLCDGSNADDQSKYRPGLRALAEEHVLSPLAEAGLTKAEITRRAQAMGFPLPAEKARPCLLTRYDYGLEVRRDELHRLELAEAELFALADGSGRRLLDDFRLRLTPAPLLQVLDWREEWLGPVRSVLERHGFAPFTILRTETISGYFDAADRKPATRPA